MMSTEFTPSKERFEALRAKIEARRLALREADAGNDVPPYTDADMKLSPFNIDSYREAARTKDK